MRYKNEDELKAALKDAVVQGVYLLYGGENFLIEAWAKKLTDSGGGASPFNTQRLDGAKTDCDLLFDAVETLPLMASEKRVLLDGLEPSKLPDNELEKLIEIISDVPPGCALIITGKAPGFDTKSAAAKKIIKVCDSAGCAAELSGRGPQGMTAFLRSAAKKNGCELSPELARYILQRCESGMSTLNREIEKICAYAGGGQPQRHHVDAVSIPKTEARVFDLGKAILAGSAQRAMEILRDLFYLREQPVAILAVLSVVYADLYRARVAKDCGATPADVVAKFGYKGKEFRVNNAWNSRVPAARLRECLSCLLDCDRRIKSTSVDGKILLEQTVIRLLALQR